MSASSEIGVHSLTPLLPQTRSMLMEVSTATVATVLYAKGFRSRFIRRVRRLAPGPNMVGPIRTLRFIAAREDLDTMKNWVRDENPQRKVCDEIGEGEVLVIEAREETSCGTMGGMLVARIFRRGAAGIVSDGPFRDTPFIASLAMPSFSTGMNANTNLIAHHPEAMDVAITCGGVHVRPGDIAVGDNEGVIVIPRHVVNEVAIEASKKEKEEAYVEQLILNGASIVGIYPMNAETRAAYESRDGTRDEASQ